jgi:hypothetical protein
LRVGPLVVGIVFDFDPADVHFFDETGNRVPLGEASEPLSTA